MRYRHRRVAPCLLRCLPGIQIHICYTAQHVQSENLFESQFWEQFDWGKWHKKNSFTDNLSKIHEGSGPKKLYFWPFPISCCRFKHEKFSIPSVALWHTFSPHRSFCFYTYTHTLSTSLRTCCSHNFQVNKRFFFILLRFNDVFQPSVSIIQTQNRELAQWLAF